MRILMINSVCGIGSTGRICTDLAESLEKQGHEVKIAYGRERVPEKFRRYALRIGSDMEVKLHGIKSRLFDKHGLGSKRATEKLVDWIKAYSPDVIYLHNIHGYYINIEILFKYLKTCGKKIIWTLHDCWAFTGHCSYFDYVGCNKWREECFACPQVKAYPKSFFVDHSRANFQKKKELFCHVPNLTLVTPSQWLAELVKQSFLREYPVEVHNNTIDTNVFKPTSNNFRERFSLQEKKIILGVASVWDERKGLADYLKLAELLTERYRIVLVGLSEKQMRGLPGNVIGIRRTNSPKELAQIYTAADVFVNLTYEDNYPTVNLEARACGTPIITYKTGGSPESAGEKAIVIEQSDFYQLKSAIVRICESDM